MSLNSLKHGQRARNLPGRLRAVGVRLDPDHLWKIRNDMFLLLGASKTASLVAKRTIVQEALTRWNASKVRRPLPRALREGLLFGAGER